MIDAVARIVRHMDPDALSEWSDIRTRIENPVRGAHARMTICTFFAWIVYVFPIRLPEWAARRIAREHRLALVQLYPGWAVKVSKLKIIGTLVKAAISAGLEALGIEEVDRLRSEGTLALTEELKHRITDAAMKEL